jgi:hypothetical protein
MPAAVAKRSRNGANGVRDARRAVSACSAGIIPTCITDLGMGGRVLGKLGGAAGAGWSNSNEAKVIAAAFLDAHNHLVTQVRQRQAKDLPPVALKPGVKS